MDTLISFVWITISAAGASAVLLVILGWLLRAWIGERLKAGIKHEYDDRLEKLRAELKSQGDAYLASMKSEVDRQAEKLRITASSFSEVQKATIPKKIEAVDVLWLGVIQTREAFPSEVWFTDIFTDEEMSGFYTNPKMKKYSAGMMQVSEMEFIKVGLNDVQRMRPHLGEYVWALYSTYRSILGRSIFLLKEGAADPKKLAWYQDGLIKSYVESAFGTEIFKEFEVLQHSRYKWLTYQFDTVLFRAIDTLLTGKEFSEAALRQAHEMERQIRLGGTLRY